VKNPKAIYCGISGRLDEDGLNTCAKNTLHFLSISSLTFT
jgi:hypothetical protein